MVSDRTDNCRMDQIRYPAVARLLVIPERDAAEAVAEAAASLTGAPAAPEVVREALSGEDDAEDVQWLVVLEAPGSGWSSSMLRQLHDLAHDAGGWVEAAD
jgi:hypothetical protein